MLDIAVIATVFALVFVGELPDKTAVTGLVLGTRYPGRWVFAGIAAAFLAHVVIAVAAGSLLTLLPRRPVEFVVAVLFLVGAVLIWREGMDSDDPADSDNSGGNSSAADDPDDAAEATGFWHVASLGFGLIFVAEWGDLTQILTANLAAKYDDPLSVGIGAVVGLWAVGLLAIVGGKALLRVLHIKWITRIAAVVMVGLGIYSLVRAIAG